MRKILLLASIVLPFAYSNAQTIKATKTQRKTCYTATYLQQLEKQNPRAETAADFERWMKTKVKQRRESRDLNDVINYTPLPIIFHVIHTGQAVGTGYNVSQARINSQLVQLNKDYANLSGSSYSVSSKTGLQFCLAAKDTNGNVLAEPGIDRIDATGKSFGQPPYSESNFESKVKAATFWDPKKYINVWVTLFTADEGILGYATFPSLSTLDGLEDTETNKSAGVVVDYLTIGSVGNSAAACNDNNNPYGTGRTLTHELGHFFGLRHIWGDASCGNDYCEDTPVHMDANFGAPIHPKSNTCGTADEMFENYMDYSDDKVMNTFTLNQAERMQIVMVNSMRRKELTSSTAGCGVIAGTSSKIGFLPCDGKMSVSEKSLDKTCENAYKDFSLYLNIEDVASGAATLSFTTGGTATAGIDYQLLTPSLKIEAGDALKLVKIRIFDDVAKESDETITISYSIAGNGVTAHESLPQTFTITIIDDDKVVVSAAERILFSQNFGTATTIPQAWSIFPSGESNRWVVSGNGGAEFTGSALHISRNGGAKPLRYDSTKASAQVAQTPAINASAFNTLKLSYKYKVAGETDNDGTYDFGLVATSPVNDATNYSYVSGPLVGVYDSVQMVVNTVSATVNTDISESTKGKEFFLNFYWENDDNTGTQPPLVIDDILVKGTGTLVESILNSSKSINVSPADTNYILNETNGKIIAAISKSSADIKCLTGKIKQAGTNQVNLQTAAGTYKRSEKVVQLTPAAPSGATSSVTLYFTTDELEKWPVINTIKVMKVQDGVDLSSTLTPANAVILTPVISDFRQSDGYASFTVTTTGFSQFFLVEESTILPLQLLTFNAATVNSAASLSWTTGNEFSNKGFNVERSLDGSSFSTIGFVAGRNATATAGNYSYSFLDKNIKEGVTYFYRLRQVDVNGKSTWSAVRSLKLNGKGGSLIVYPNPAKTLAHVVTGKTLVASANLTTASGNLVWHMPKRTISGTGFDVPMAQLPAGVYMLWIDGDNGRQNIKIVKE